MSNLSYKALSIAGDNKNDNISEAIKKAVLFIWNLFCICVNISNAVPGVIPKIIPK